MSNYCHFYCIVSIKFIAILAASVAIPSTSAIAQECNSVSLWEQNSFSSLNFSERYIRHSSFLGYLSDPRLPNPNTKVEFEDATFDVLPGFSCRQNIPSVSIRSRNYPKRWMRHSFWRIRFDEYDQGAQPSDLFKKDASFEMVVPGLAGQCVSFRSVNYPDRYIRHRNFELWLDVLENTDLFRRDATFCKQPPRAGYYRATDESSKPPDTPPTIPTISVSLPQSQTFLVQGSGFLPGKQVAIRIADDALNPNLFYYTTATANGSINMTLSIPCSPSRLYFSANDGRQNSSDRTGMLWSNTVTLSCQ
ncbi:AbfB domain-containing protein [Leptolyngbya sp. UWPOB_LEPTO1]|uniref:AbfB domain-containing protein n=1 Tax=Leptolyngbya sp. UWPOB_LEPTO1 TaxID=2815653 RepID=UPI00338E9A9D